ncbi:MAG: hypothetical protein ACJ79S_03290 [Gemmatimonadaceae bacterium]
MSRRLQDGSIPGARPANPLSAALAGLPTVVQPRGVWAGRRQLCVQFAAEAETATVFTAESLATALGRLSGRSPLHSIVLTGRDVLAHAPFLAATFHARRPSLPVMLETDGQRPESVAGLAHNLALVQVTLDFARAEGGDLEGERAAETLAAADGTGVAHALVLVPRPSTSDARLLRVVERAHAASRGTMIVIHPASTLIADVTVDHRWSALLEQAAALHGDVRLLREVWV